MLVTVSLAADTFVGLGWLRPVVVAGDSMAPTLTGADRLRVSRWRTPRRWDVVVLRPPTDACRLAVKRVVGLPGEEVTFRQGMVWADGQRRSPGNRAAAADVYYGAFGNPTWRLGPDEWFVVGDNPRVSADSRHWGPVPGRLVVGVVR